jgi:hypothetical protein
METIAWSLKDEKKFPSPRQQHCYGTLRLPSHAPAILDNVNQIMDEYVD